MGSDIRGFMVKGSQNYGDTDTWSCESTIIWKRGTNDVRRWLYLESLYLQKHHCGKHLDIRMSFN